jgi:hypothetical protein
MITAALHRMFWRQPCVATHTSYALAMSGHGFLTHRWTSTPEYRPMTLDRSHHIGTTSLSNQEESRVIHLLGCEGVEQASMLVEKEIQR